MCDKQILRPACAYAQSDQNLCLSLEYSMTVKLLTEHHLEFLCLKKAAQARLSLFMSKCHIVGNHMSRLNYVYAIRRRTSSCQEILGRNTLAQTSLSSLAHARIHLNGVSLACR